MPCVYSLEARGLESYLGFTFLYFFLLSERMAWIKSSKEAVFITNLLVCYQKKHCFPKVSSKRIFGKSLANCPCAGGTYSFRYSHIWKGDGEQTEGVKE